MAEKNGYLTEEVSAKSGDKVHDAIKNFGISIARAKMEKSGLYWFANSTAPTSFSSTPSSTTTQSQKAQENTTTVTNDPVPVTSK